MCSLQLALYLLFYKEKLNPKNRNAQPLSWLGHFTRQSVRVDIYHGQLYRIEKKITKNNIQNHLRYRVKSHFTPLKDITQHQWWIFHPLQAIFLHSNPSPSPFDRSASPSSIPNVIPPQPLHPEPHTSLQQSNTH